MIYTFYSYKGGVGRIHLLANMAAYLCYYQKRNILMIDWDLEAPGLHFYFDKNPKDNSGIKLKNEDIKSKGLINLLNKHIEVFRNSEKEVLDEDDFYNPFEQNEEKYIQNLVNTENQGKIDLMPAIEYKEGYHTEVEEFDWVKSYDNFYIGSYLLWLKEKLKRKYDYVFIDSRTGFNDYSGICNVLMPDMNIILVAPNEQNFAGAKIMANRIINSPYTKSEARSPFVLPILSRLDTSHPEADDWRRKFANTFAFLIDELDEDIKAYKAEVLEQVSALTVLEYQPKYAVGEKIQFKADAQRLTAGSILENFENIALNFLEEMNQQGEVNLNKIVGDKMIPVYRRNIRQNPQDYESYFGLGYVYDKLENYIEAERYYQKAVEINPNYHSAWNNLGVLYNDLQKYEKAIKIFQKLINLNPDDYEVWNNLGSVHVRLKNYENAIEAYQTAIKIQPTYYQAWYNLGIIYADLQSYNKAIETYQKAIEIKPEHHKAWYNLGNIYIRLREYIKAKEHFKKSIEIKPNKEEAIFNLACTYSLEKNKEYTLKYLKRAIELNQKLKENAKKDKDFEWLWEDSDFLALLV